MIGRALIASLLVVDLASAQAAPRQAMVVAEVAPRTPTVDAAIAALVRGAAGGKTTVVTAGDGSLADSAFIVGCEPTADTCRDAVARQLGLDALWIVAADGATVTVAVRPVGGPTSTRRVPMPQPTAPAGIAALEAAGRSWAGGAAPVDAGAGGSTSSRPRVDPGTDHLAPRSPDAPVADPPEPPQFEPAPATAAAVARPIPVGAIGLGVGGGVLLLGGAVMWGLAASTQGDIDAAPAQSAADLQHLAALEDTGRTYAGLGNAMVIGGSLAVVAAGAWIYWTRHHGAETRLAPVVGGGAAGLTLEGTW